jgi:long-chain acyl-CoA synthetase
LKCKLISEIFLHGDSHQAYAVAVVVPNKEEVKRYAGEKGIDGMIESLFANPIIRKWLLKELNIFGRKQGLYGFELAKNIHL